MSKTNPEQPYTWATDATFSSGDASGRDTKTAPAGAPAVAQGFVPGTAGASPYLNWAKNRDGQWLNFLKDIQICNWNWLSVESITSNNLVHACYSPALNHYVLVGDEETIVVATNEAANAVISTGLNFVFCFASTNNGGSVVALQGDTDVSEWNGSTWTTNTETASDILLTGVQDVDGGNDVIVGFLGGTDLGFIYGTTAGNSDLSRSASTFSVPDLGGGASTARGNVDSTNIVIAEDGDGRLLCLVSYHGSSSGRIDQHISTDGGATWAQTTNVMSGITTATSTSVVGLAWDADASLWVAVTRDSRVLTAGAAGSSSWTEVAGTTDIYGTAVTTTSRVIVDGGIWLTRSGTNVAWSRDAGTSWSSFATPVGGTAIAHSAERGQFLLGGLGGFGGDRGLALSLAVGP